MTGDSKPKMGAEWVTWALLVGCVLVSMSLELLWVDNRVGLHFAFPEEWAPLLPLPHIVLLIMLVRHPAGRNTLALAFGTGAFLTVACFVFLIIEILQLEAKRQSDPFAGFELFVLALIVAIIAVPHIAIAVTAIMIFQATNANTQGNAKMYRRALVAAGANCAWLTAVLLHVWYSGIGFI